MLPIRDENPTRITPWVTFLVIGICLLVFFGVQNQGGEQDQVEFLFRRAAIACEVRTGTPLSPSEITEAVCQRNDEAPIFPEKQPWISVFTSMFLHGGVGHVLFNMWFLWIFGNNVEEAFGHLRYILLYVAGGIVATLAFVFVNPDSTVPLVGASGAIAAVLGAYGVLFPTHRVLSLFGWFLVHVPAALFLGLWFLAQFGLGGTNTAWEAHVGGFIFGLVVAALFRGSLLRRAGQVHARS